MENIQLPCVDLCITFNKKDVKIYVTIKQRGHLLLTITDLFHLQNGLVSTWNTLIFFTLHLQFAF